MIAPALLAVVAATRTPGPGSPLLVGGALFALLVAPIQAAAFGLLALAVVRFRRAAGPARRGRAAQTASLEVAELIALGLAGGFSVAAAHRVALDHCPPEVAPQLGRLVASIDRRGVEAALAEETGPLSTVSDVLVAATATGAPALAALEAHIRQAHHVRHTAAVEAARRLPIRLLIPLTLVVLPGFVLITVGPTVVESLARLVP